MSTSLACIALLGAGLKTRSEEKDKNKNFQLKFKVFSPRDRLLNKSQHVSFDLASEGISLQPNSCLFCGFVFVIAASIANCHINSDYCNYYF